MNGFVWATSYLCIFMLGCVFIMTCIWVLTVKDDQKTEKQFLDGAAAELPTVEKPVAPYDFDQASQN